MVAVYYADDLSKLVEDGKPSPVIASLPPFQPPVHRRSETRHQRRFHSIMR